MAARYSSHLQPLRKTLAPGSLKPAGAKISSSDFILRFRPNIHIDTHDNLLPYDEDDWVRLAIQTESGTVSAKRLFKAIRCLSLNVDMEEGFMVTR